MNDIALQNSKGDIMESVLLKGDLSKLSPEERSSYYLKVCESVGLNPLTRPFEYITLNGKLTLYAKRDATDQLRTVHAVSVDELLETEREGVFIVTAKVRNKDGRTDIAKGAVNITGLKGEALANAMMKAETKAKRRATLSLCGLGFLDETEVETITDAKPMQDATPPARSPFKNSAIRNTFFNNCKGAFNESRTVAELKEIADLNSQKFQEMRDSGNEYDELAVEELVRIYKQCMARLSQAPIEYDHDEQPEYPEEQRVYDDHLRDIANG